MEDTNEEARCAYARYALKVTTRRRRATTTMEYSSSSLAVGKGNDDRNRDNEDADSDADADAGRLSIERPMLEYLARAMAAVRLP